MSSRVTPDAMLPPRLPDRQNQDGQEECCHEQYHDLDNPSQDNSPIGFKVGNAIQKSADDIAVCQKELVLDYEHSKNRGLVRSHYPAHRH
jgi:hypothetical protein